MKMLDFYKAILETASLTADADGRVSVKIDDQEAPLTIKGQRLVLPTREHMRQEDKSGILMFHPLQEVITQGESEVMARYRTCVNTWLNYVIGNLTTHLIKLAASPGLHARLRPDQLEMLRIFKDADDKLFANFGQIVKAMPAGSSDKCFVNIFLKSKAHKGDVVHRRGAIVNFPLHAELLANETKPYGVALRKKDGPAIRALLEYLFPDGMTDGGYNAFSTSNTVPTLEVMLECIKGLAECINAAISDFQDVIPELKEFAIVCDWEAAATDLSQFDSEVRMTPMQKGNEGGVENSPVAAPTGPQAGATQWVSRAPQPAPAPAAVADTGVIYTANGKIDFAAMSRRQYAPQGQQQANNGYTFMPMGSVSGPEAVRQGPPSWERPGSASYVGQQPMGQNFGNFRV